MNGVVDPGGLDPDPTLQIKPNLGPDPDLTVKKKNTFNLQNKNGFVLRNRNGFVLKNNTGSRSNPQNINIKYKHPYLIRIFIYFLHARF